MKNTSIEIPFSRKEVIERAAIGREIVKEMRTENANWKPGFRFMDATKAAIQKYGANDARRIALENSGFPNTAENRKQAEHFVNLAKRHRPYRPWEGE